VNVIRSEPAALFGGRLLIAVPHMDDCILACGGTLSRLPHKERIHVVYASDGRASPIHPLPWRRPRNSRLADLRMAEARAALAYVGLPPANVHFLGLPDGRLTHHRRTLERCLRELMFKIEPDQVLAPFRYDGHPDHLAVNHAVTELLPIFPVELYEYFVYYRWRLLPGRDVRRYLAPDQLRVIDISPVAARKRAALSYFHSQTTCFYGWQTRPNLTPALLSQVCREPEMFLCYDGETGGAAVFTRAATWIRLVHRLEPALKKTKDRLVALGHLAGNANGH
jgi:LmbE family N-acetylglucosaminyl deacetylase